MPPEPADPPPWRLVGFEERLDQWIELETPDQDLRLRVLDWVFTRFADPYQGVRREPGFPNLWFGEIPGTVHGNSDVVVCSYWIAERDHIVRCDSIATLRTPT